MDKSAEIDPGREFLAGAREGIAISAAVIPFALLFGASAVQAGFSVFEAVFASATVFGGASQFVFIEVYGLGVPGWLVVSSVFAVNFRHILYSASLGRWMTRFSAFRKMAAFFFLTDMQWAASEMQLHSRSGGVLTTEWYFGYAAPIYLLWIFSTWFGAVSGSMIEHPEKFGLDFLLPIYFVTILVGFRKRKNFLPVLGISAAASYLTLLFVGQPWHIIAGATAGVTFAALLPVTENYSRSLN
jgi:branched chain amino acid efflux pump